MSTKPRPPSEHHREAERLIAAAITESPANAPALALAHAVLTLSPRRARRVERAARHASALPPKLGWGDKQQG
jgi:hypothetical protein